MPTGLEKLELRKVSPSEILDLTRYEQTREAYLAETIKMKKSRRVTVGDRLTFIFENRETVIFQIQEMVRAERIVRPEAIEGEVTVYNELIPDTDSLSATLMIEIPEMEQIRTELDRLIGIDEHVYLEVEGERLTASFDEKQFEADRIAAVQYVKFALGQDLAERFRDEAVPVVLGADHPNYVASCALEGPIRASLAADLAPGA